MYKLPDHVTRYNHKNTNRWLVQTARPRSCEGAEMLMKSVSMAMAVAGLIVTAVMMMQGVA
jgi:hypothetical protein